MKNKNSRVRSIFSVGLIFLLLSGIGVYANDRSADAAKSGEEEYASLIERRNEIEKTSNEGVEGRTLAARIYRQTELMEDFAAYYETYGWKKYLPTDILKPQMRTSKPCPANLS